MRRLLVLHILAFLSVLPAQSRLSLAIFPQEKRYVVSLAQQNPITAWDGQLFFSSSEPLRIALPSRLMISMQGVSVSLGYAGFWQEYALFSSETGKQALLLQTKDTAFALLMDRYKRAVGFERVIPKGELSILAWMQRRKELASFQNIWGSDNAKWGVVGKALLRLEEVTLHAELLFTPVHGMDIYIASSYKLGASEFGFAYGEEPYPTRYTLALTLQSRSMKISFMMEDWFGSKPIYGGFSSIRKRKQRSVLEFSQKTGYLLFSFRDTYDFTSRGSEGGSVLMQATWAGSFGQVSAQYEAGRGPGRPRKNHFKLSLALCKATLSYTDQGYELTLSDSVILGKGVGTWKLKKGMGRPLSLALVYAVTSGR